MTQFAYDNVMQIPRLVKIVVNMGVGEAARDAKLMDGAVRDLTAITGQKPAVVTGPASPSRSSSCARACRSARKVTLRGDRMWEFLDRLLSIALPRIRDFRGLSPSSSTATATTPSVSTEQSMFHEIDVDKVDRQRGMDITVVTTATNDDEGRELLRQLGLPLRRRPSCHHPLSR